MMRVSIASLAALSVLIATPALAHVGPGTPSAFSAGLAHPIAGADHILAMMAVGLWAAAIGGRAVLAVPTAFIAAMVGGAALAMAGVGLPAVEPMILASVVVLGLLVAAAMRPAASAAAALVGAFAVFHGYAHGAEMGGAGALGFGAGFALSTALLHGAGIGLGLYAARSTDKVSRIAGAATALAGLGLMAA